MGFRGRARAQGGLLVAVLADRVGPSGRDRIVRANFLGEPAAFPAGPFLISMLMRLPMVMTVALKTGSNRYDVFFEEIAGGEAVPREHRAKSVQERVETFASRLEHYCGRAPLQWFNFFDFWEDAGHERD